MAVNARVVWAAGLGLALGLAGGWLLSGAPSGDPPQPVRPAGNIETVAAEVAAVADMLQRERRAREALEAEVAALRASLAESEPSEVPGAETALDEGETPTADVAAEPDPAGFDAAALEALDLDAAEIRRLRERHEELELERLYLRDLARREGWLNRPRYRRELAALRQEALEQLGGRDYDAMLYATGRNNRVIVSRPLANSPAEVAGLRAGDAILSYDGKRIFEPRAIVEATASGERGSLTELRIERDGEELRLFVPRGPLGITLRRGRRPPDVR